MSKKLRDEVKNKLLVAIDGTKDNQENLESAKEILIKAIENPTVVRTLGTFIGNG